LKAQDYERRLLAAEERVKVAGDEVMSWKMKHGAWGSRRERLQERAQEHYKQLMEAQERAERSEEEVGLWKDKFEALEKRIGDVIIL
jgi:chromosome segregation ATPase